MTSNFGYPNHFFLCTNFEVKGRLIAPLKLILDTNLLAYQIVGLIFFDHRQMYKEIANEHLGHVLDSLVKVIPDVRSYISQYGNTGSGFSLHPNQRQFSEFNT